MTAPGFGHLWRSGRIVRSDEAMIHVRSVGHASVSAVFEGINAYWNERRDQLFVFRLREHLRRLLTSAQLAYLTVGFDVDQLEAATVDLLRYNGVRQDVHIRPWVFPSGNPTEQMVGAGAETEAVVEIRPFTSGLREPRTCTAAVTSWTRFDPNAMPARCKAFANYHNGRLGNIDAQRRGADWPIFLDGQGRVTESSGATIALVRNGELHTPALGVGLLDGITRDTVLRLAREELGVLAVEGDIERADLYLADEVLFIGTSAEVLPIVRIDDHTVGDGGIGPLTTKLRSAYGALIRGDQRAEHHWLTPVWPDGGAKEPST